MPPPRRVPDPLTAGPFSTRAAAELIGRGQLRGSSYRRLTRGVYQEAGAGRGYPEKIRAMRLLVPHDAVLAGLGAAWAHGVHSAGVADHVEFICAPGRVRGRTGLVLRADRLPAGEIVLTPFGLTTSPVRTAFDLARAAAVPRDAARRLLNRLDQGSPRLRPAAPTGAALIGIPAMAGEATGSPTAAAARLVTAISLADALLRAGKVGTSALATVLNRHPGVRGLWSARLVLAMADPRAESPPESVLRARIVLAGLPWPEPQYEIFDKKTVFVARVDLGWPEFLLGAEYDGAYHDEKPQVRRDRKRDLKGHKVKWRLVHLDRDDLRNVPGLIHDLHTVMRQQLARD